MTNARRTLMRVLAYLSLIVSITAIAATKDPPPSVRKLNENLTWMKPFKIRAVAAEGEHLVGIAHYRDKMGLRPLEVDGTRTADGRFWPRVVAEVADDPGGEWKRLEQPSNSGVPAVSTLVFYEANPTLYVNLDIFRSLVSEMRYGRVVLPGDEPAIFELKELLPSETSKESDAKDWSHETIFGYLEDPLVRPPFAIAEISFREGHLRGMGGYFDPTETSPAAIEGTQTPDEEFWPYAMLQVANDPNGVWTTIGASVKPGLDTVALFSKESTTILNIDLDPFRPSLGKFGYGRIVLRNGKSAAFQLVDLLSPGSPDESKLWKDPAGNKEGTVKQPGQEMRHVAVNDKDPRRSQPDPTRKAPPDR